MIGRLLKYLSILVVLAVIALSAFAYLGDLAPSPSEESLTVTLDAD